MNKAIVSNLMTVDGYVAGPGGDVMALPFDDSFTLRLAEARQLPDSNTALLRHALE
ncbi:hypothetical protein [Aeromicrobium sp.]|uniref:hypothetical protein n=1 Tax=Aeromicrobium sp. TaxID=1871063 RepID=UPI003D6ABC20